MTTEIAIRPTAPSDTSAILELACKSLGWAGDERDRAFFEWKHLQNPFGASPAWAAMDGERLVAFRTMLRWRFRSAGGRLEMVRAVDTATDPEYQGRGLFRRLTTEAVESLTADGIDAVFNTPNEQSRPGYLKMGWTALGRPALMVQPSSPSAAARMLAARVPAEKWSLPVSVGVRVTDALDDLVVDPASATTWVTDRTPDYLAWRYGFEPLRYRAVEVRDGHAIFRVRNRGSLREVAFVEWLSPSVDPRAVRRVVRDAGADYAVAIGSSVRHGFLPVPRQGPVVTWRPLARSEVPELRDLDVALGDLELF
jgi:GNAT superfamily N-acetyltransferase